MIRLRRLNSKPLVVNADLIEHIDATPDTVLVLRSGEKLVVLESADEVIAKVIEFRREIAAGAHVCRECMLRESEQQREAS